MLTTHLNTPLPTHRLQEWLRERMLFVLTPQQAFVEPQPPWVPPVASPPAAAVPPSLAPGLGGAGPRTRGLPPCAMQENLRTRCRVSDKKIRIGLTRCGLTYACSRCAWSVRRLGIEPSGAIARSRRDNSPGPDGLRFLAAKQLDGALLHARGHCSCNARSAQWTRSWQRCKPTRPARVPCCA